jgi:hypothetical protein
MSAVEGNERTFERFGPLVEMAYDKVEIQEARHDETVPRFCIDRPSIPGGNC